MRKLIILDSPYSAHRLYQAIKRSTPSVRLLKIGPWRWADYAETSKLVMKIEREEAEKQKMKG